jgi:2-polyprenyl-3-methyl-5-hydroxy-6-metoxy-1,4-benzoquinol methylase
MASPELNGLDCLLPLMNSRGVQLSPLEFHYAVNVTFHAFESQVYDENHQDMRLSLPRQFELLCDDVLARGPEPGAGLNILDVGCGTGLGSELLLKTSLGQKVGRIDLLDTSPEMLAKCAERASTWGLEYRVLEGTVEAVASGCYDLVLACSVLHHIPDLDGFSVSIRRLQRQGGIFLHLQDPNGDYFEDRELANRVGEIDVATRKRVPSWVRRMSPLRVASRIRREITRTQPKGYIQLVNERLLGEGVILEPMTAEEIWSVTDIHVDGLPFSLGKGVSVTAMKARLVDHDLIASRSYGFFGQLWSELPPRFKAREEELIDQKKLNGRYIGCVWQHA